MRKKSSARRAIESARHSTNACVAAWTAASISSTLAKSTAPVWTPVAGLKTAPLRPEAPFRLEPPIQWVIGLTAALMIGGAVVTETVFGLPGVGNLVVSAVLRRDYPVIQGALLVIAAIYVLINFAIDLLYMAVDPRVKL